MSLDTWKKSVQPRLRTISQTVGAMTPGMIYGALTAATVFPLAQALQAAAGQNNIAAMLVIGNFAGQLGGNLLMELLSQWKDRSEADLQTHLPQAVQHNAELRQLFDTLLEKAELPRIVQAILSEADKDELKRHVTHSVQALQQALTQMGSRITIAGDQIMGDKIAGDKVAGDKIAIHETHHHHAAPADPKPDLRRRYLQRLQKQCNSLPLATLGGDEESGAKVTLDQVYIDLNTRSFEPFFEAEKEERKNQGAQLAENEQKQLSALTVFTRHANLVLLGEPGGGKSTFVQKLAGWVAAVALGEQTQDLPSGWSPNLLPIFTVLRDLAPRLANLALAGLSDEERDRQLLRALLDLWREELAEKNCAAFYEAFEETLAAGQVLLVFDGLDEVPQPTRDRVRWAVNALLHHYGAIERVIITCRVRSYLGNALLPGWPVHSIAPFDKEQIDQFIEGWYRTQQRIGQVRSEKECLEQITDLQQAVRGEALRELAENPMLLTTMALIHQRSVRLPNQRVKLYQLAVENLLQRWQRRKIKVSPRLEALLNDERKLRKIMERIAYESLLVRNRVEKQRAKGKTNQRPSQEEQEESGDLRRGELLVLLEDPLYLPENGLPDEFLDYIDHRAGLLVGPGGQEETGAAEPERKPISYRFPHRTFQEYLAGCYLVSRPDVADEYWQHAAQGDGWELAALLGGEELFFNSSSGSNTLLTTLTHLCPSSAPRNKDDWRRLLWSAQLATLFDRLEIERHSRGKETGKAYLKRLTERLLLAIDIKSKLSPQERATAGTALGKLGDRRKGVGLITQGGRLIPEIDWIEIEAGAFIMGSDKAKDERAFDWEMPQFTCTLIEQPYCISRYPITVAQFGEFVRSGGYHTEKYWTAAGWNWHTTRQIEAPERYGRNFETLNHPQVGVSWYEAVAFCRWLTELLGYEVRLPSEAQWERVARHVDGRIYPWGDKWDERQCNNYASKLECTSTVGIFPSGNAACGAADLSGNVWEWCSTQWRDNYEDYQSAVSDELEGDEGRLVRGGAWNVRPYYVRGASRGRLVPGTRGGNVGFRVVLASPGS